MNARVCIALALSATLGACSREPLSGPPEVRLGRERCAECGMLIGEERCSAATLVERAGRREHLNFDDVGCLLDFERGGDDRSIVSRFVRDHETTEWIDAERALFLIAEPSAVRTPMGSGMIAFASEASAERARGQHGGRVAGLAGVAEARRVWAESMRPGSSGGFP